MITHIKPLSFIIDSNSITTDSAINAQLIAYSKLIDAGYTHTPYTGDSGLYVFKIGTANFIDNTIYVHLPITDDDEFHAYMTYFNCELDIEPTQITTVINGTPLAYIDPSSINYIEQLYLQLLPYAKLSDYGVYYNPRDLTKINESTDILTNVDYETNGIYLSKSGYSHFNEYNEFIFISIDSPYYDHYDSLLNDYCC